MANDEQHIDGLSEAEKALARHIETLVPLMREQDRGEAEMSEAFAQRLRDHLVHGDELASRPTLARKPRRRFVYGAGARPLNSIWRRRRIQGVVSTITLALIASIVFALLLPRQSVFAVPSPTRADLIFSFPAPPTVVHRLTPTGSLIHPAPGIPFRGHLTLRTNTLPIEPAELHAYRLAPPGNAVGLGRRLFDIHATARRVIAGTTAWEVAADGGSGETHPLHSIAVSLASGELIYHDRRNAMLRHARHVLARQAAVAVTRRWLTELGWPGAQMPVRSVGDVEAMPKVRQVVLGWPGVQRAPTEAATLWITPQRSVIEAWVWPPVVRRGVIPARPISTLWAEVRRGELPLAVKGVFTRTGAGTGLLRRVSIVPVLVPTGHVLYLVPTYRFEGVARLHGRSRTYVWYSLAPGG